jgi:methylmalonyl-CoA mutase C-terminal domain/subunit
MIDKSSMRKRILLAKVGLDGHDRGVKIIVSALKEAGYQVIYSGLHKSPNQIANIVFQEDVDAVGISILSGSHLPLFLELISLLKTDDSKKILIFGGGTIPQEDILFLEKNGVDKLFPTGSSLMSITEWLRITWADK